MCTADLLLKYMEQQKFNCVMILPRAFDPRVNKMLSHMKDYCIDPFNNTAFTILTHAGKRVPKTFAHIMVEINEQVM